MSKRKMVVKALVVLVGLFLLSAPTAYSQLCKGDFNCDGMVTGAELGQFAVDFGRQDCPSCPPCEGCQAFINENIDDICTGYSCDPPAPLPETGFGAWAESRRSVSRQGQSSRTASHKG